MWRGGNEVVSCPISLFRYGNPPCTWEEKGRGSSQWQIKGSVRSPYFLSASILFLTPSLIDSVVLLVSSSFSWTSSASTLDSFTCHNFTRPKLRETVAAVRLHPWVHRPPNYKQGIRLYTVHTCTLSFTLDIALFANTELKDWMENLLNKT